MVPYWPHNWRRSLSVVVWERPRIYKLVRLNCSLLFEDEFVLWLFPDDETGDPPPTELIPDDKPFPCSWLLLLIDWTPVEGVEVEVTVLIIKRFEDADWEIGPPFDVFTKWRIRDRGWAFSLLSLSFFPCLTRSLALSSLHLSPLFLTHSLSLPLCHEWKPPPPPLLAVPQYSHRNTRADLYQKSQPVALGTKTAQVYWMHSTLEQCTRLSLSSPLCFAPTFFLPLFYRQKPKNHWRRPVLRSDTTVTHWNAKGEWNVRKSCDCWCDHLMSLKLSEQVFERNIMKSLVGRNNFTLFPAFNRINMHSMFCWPKWSFVIRTASMITNSLVVDYNLDLYMISIMEDNDREWDILFDFLFTRTLLSHKSWILWQLMISSRNRLFNWFY